MERTHCVQNRELHLKTEREKSDNIDTGSYGVFFSYLSFQSIHTYAHESHARGTGTRSHVHSKTHTPRDRDSLLTCANINFALPSCLPATSPHSKKMTILLLLLVGFGEKHDLDSLVKDILETDLCQGRALLERHRRYPFPHGVALLTRDWTLLAPAEPIKLRGVVPQIELRPNEDLGHAWRMVGNLGRPLVGHVCEGVGVD